MNKNIKIYIIIGIVIIILCILKIPNFIVKGLSGELSYKYSVENIVFRLFEDKEEKIINSNELKNYLNNTYKKISTDFNIDYMGVFSNSNIRGVHGWYYRSWIRAYEISTPFMSKPFEVWVDNRTHEIFGDNFYEVLANDPKFQHLYSEWVKKKIGCKDDNVELEFDLARDKHNSVHKKISIDFTSIVDVSNIEEEICRNTKNYMLYSIDKKKLDKNNKSNFLDEAKKIKESFYNDIISNNCQDILWENINIKLYYYDVDLAFDRYNNSLVNSNEDNFYYVRFGLKDNTIKYISDTFDCMYSGLIPSNWFTQVE